MPRPPRPIVGKNVFIAETAYVGGNIVIGDNSTIMHHVVIRADIAPIRIGSGVNIQDGAIVHTPHGIALDIGDNVGIGHRAVVHCRRIGERTLIGIGSIVLDDCNIGSRCVIAAGAVIPPGTTVPDGKVVMGVPGKVIRDVEERDLKIIDHVVGSYVALGRLHQAGQFPNIAQA